MLRLSKPASWYFETCRQIMWSRLSYGKLFVLYSDEALGELEAIWRAALTRAMQPDSFVDAEALLDDTIQADDREWRRLTGIVEAALDMPGVVEDYFLGVSASEIVDEVEGGGYHGKAD